MTPRRATKELWTLTIGKRFAKMDRTREQIAGLAALSEHARAVRILKAEIEKLAHMIAEDQRQNHHDTEAIHTYALSTIEDILAAIQRGR